MCFRHGRPLIRLGLAWARARPDVFLSVRSVKSCCVLPLRNSSHFVLLSHASTPHRQSPIAITIAIAIAVMHWCKATFLLFLLTRAALCNGCDLPQTRLHGRRRPQLRLDSCQAQAPNPRYVFDHNSKPAVGRARARTPKQVVDLRRDLDPFIERGDDDDDGGSKDSSSAATPAPAPASPSPTASQSDNDDMDILLARRVQSTLDPLTTGQGQVNEWVKSQQEDGTWSDVDYTTGCAAR